VSAIERVPRSAVRASDGDREDTTARLRRAYTEGCLSAEEFEQRLDLALSAQTRGDLKRLLADLPGRSRPTREKLERAQRKAFREHATTYVGVNTGLIAIWAATGAELSAFWPIWSIGGWGIFLWGHGRASRRMSKRLRS
jgi:hypothetical protein